MRIYVYIYIYIYRPAGLWPRRPGADRGREEGVLRGSE